MNSMQAPPAENKSQSFANSGPARGVIKEDAPLLGPRRVGYGLPCSKCKTYYAADLKSCPVCQATERVSPLDAPVVTNQSATAVAELPDPAKLEEERERFLREFQSRVPMEIQTTENYHCTHGENHPDTFEPATVCQGCYDLLQQRVDHMEAALLIDAKEAASIVYDAVWSDPSDPSKTYANAAEALLTELRSRAGVRMIVSPMQRLSH
jgi:RNA polymerase subunit RPABC4/transcription elongation factor Spt4